MIRVYPISATGLEFLLEQYAEQTYTTSSSDAPEMTSPYTQSTQNIFNSSDDDINATTVNRSLANATSFAHISTTSLMNLAVDEAISSQSEAISSQTITGEVKKLNLTTIVVNGMKNETTGKTKNQNLPHGSGFTSDTLVCHVLFDHYFIFAFFIVSLLI